MTLDDLNRMSVEAVTSAVDPMRTPPEAPVNVTATTRTFGILVQWSRVEGCDGYLVMVSSDQDFSSPLDQKRVIGDSNVSYSYDTGNVAVARYFAVKSYSGDVFSERSSVVTATSTNVETGASQTSAPGSDTFDNNEKTLASTTLTTTGRTVLVLAQGRVHNPDANGYELRLYEDSTLIHTVPGFSTDEIESTLFKLRTPAAGSHTYALKGINTSGATVLSVDSLNMVAAEFAFSTSVETGTAPAEPQAAPLTPPDIDYIPYGPGFLPQGF